jgi:hypothetical protein
MKFLKKLFKKEKEEKKQVENQFIPSPVPKEQWICDFCNGTIDCGERWSKFQGKYYHKQCFKKMKQGIQGGVL